MKFPSKKCSDFRKEIHQIYKLENEIKVLSIKMNLITIVTFVFSGTGIFGDFVNIEIEDFRGQIFKGWE